MAYTPNPANANGINEAEYLADFQRHQAAIEAQKRSRGGSYEDAYRAVTGRPWPDGRSVKVNGGRAEMTKDRTALSVAGKYVLPAAAAALTGGAALGVGPLAGVFGGAAAGGAGATGGAAAGGAGAGAGGVLSSSQLAMSPLYAGPIAGVSQNVSRGVPSMTADFLGNKPSLGRRVVNGVRDAATGGDGMNAWQQAALAALAGLPGLVASKQGPSDEEKALMDQMRRQAAQQEQMQAAQMQRFNYQNPLFESVSRLAMSRLPTSVQAPLGGQ